MGAGASALPAVPDTMDKTTAKALAGESWTEASEAQFDEAAANGMVSKAQFEACARRCYGVGCTDCASATPAATAATAPGKTRTKTTRVASSTQVVSRIKVAPSVPGSGLEAMQVE